MSEITGWTDQDIPDQTGKVAIVTGGNSGIGYETVRILAQRGAHVILAARNAIKGEEAVAKILSENPSANVETQPLDLADLSSIAEFAGSVQRTRNSFRSPDQQRWDHGSPQGDNSRRV